jgi:hypothetical protein
MSDRKWSAPRGLYKKGTSPTVARGVAVSTTPCGGVRASSNLVEQPSG